MEAKIRKQITYESDTDAIEKLGHLVEVFNIDKLSMKKVKAKKGYKFKVNITMH